MAFVGDTAVLQCFSGCASHEDRVSVLVALLTDSEISSVYDFLLDASEAGLLYHEYEERKNDLAWWECHYDVFGMYPSGLDLLEPAAAAYRFVTGKKPRPEYESIDKEEEAIALARNGNYDALLVYLAPVCEYLTNHFVDKYNNPYFNKEEVLYDVYIKLSEKHGAFIKSFNPELSSIKTWVSYCVWRDLSKKFKAIDRLRNRAISCDIPISKSESRETYVDTIPDEAQSFCSIDTKWVEKLLKDLENEEECKVIEAIWLKNATLADVALDMGCSVSKVHRLERKGLKALRRLAREKKLF